jgi:hypothetical protein
MLLVAMMHATASEHHMFFFMVVNMVNITLVFASDAPQKTSLALNALFRSTVLRAMK